MIVASSATEQHDYRIVVLANHGSLSNQQQLHIAALQTAFGVDAIVQVRRRHRSRARRYRRELEKHGLLRGGLVLANIPVSKLLSGRVAEERSKLLESSIDRNAVAEIPRIDGGILNTQQSVEILEQQQADIVFQCGAGLLRGPTIRTAAVGVLNLHHGIIPAIRGMGSVEWAIRENRPAWIGISLHVIDEGIDTGPLVGQARCRLERGDDLAQILSRLDLLGARLLVDGIAFLQRQGVALPAPPEMESQYRSSFTILDTLAYAIRRRSFLSSVERDEEYAVGEYLAQ